MSRLQTLIIIILLIIGLVAFSAIDRRDTKVSSQPTPGGVLNPSPPPVPEVFPAVTYYDPILQRQQTVPEYGSGVQKGEDSSTHYVSFLIDDKWTQQMTIDGAQSGNPDFYKSTLEDITTARGLQGQRFTQTSAGVLVTQWYYFDLGSDKVLFLQTSTEPQDQGIIQEVINSITF